MYAILFQMSQSRGQNKAYHNGAMFTISG